MSDFSIDVELADTEAKRVLGLMHRPQLPKNKGMLFVFDKTANHSFWNKNVNFDLSLGFFDEDGILLIVKDMAAQNPIPIHANSENVKFVLETNKGFFDKNNINIGSKIEGLKRISQKEENIMANNNLKIKESYEFDHRIRINKHF
jgi:uncharacterized protein